jgi:hypothetical protein
VIRKLMLAAVALLASGQAFAQTANVVYRFTIVSSSSQYWGCVSDCQSTADAVPYILGELTVTRDSIARHSADTTNGAVSFISQPRSGLPFGLLDWPHAYPTTDAAIEVFPDNSSVSGSIRIVSARPFPRSAADALVSLAEDAMVDDDVWAVAMAVVATLALPMFW